MTISIGAGKRWRALLSSQGFIVRCRGSCRNNSRFCRNFTLTPALSHLMGEGESSAVGVRIQPIWELQTTDQAVPSPVGRERGRVRVNLLELRLLLVSYFSTSPKSANLNL